MNPIDREDLRALAVGIVGIENCVRTELVAVIEMLPPACCQRHRQMGIQVTRFGAPRQGDGNL